MSNRIRHRSGFSLIELLVVISIGSSLMLLAIGVVHQAMNFSSRGNARDICDRALNRLAIQFRRDIHQASGVEMNDTLEFSISGPLGSVIRYQIAERGILRIETKPDEQPARETYPLRDGTSAAIESISGNPLRIRLTVVHDPNLAGIDPRVERQIVAVVGARLRRQSP